MTKTDTAVKELTGQNNVPETPAGAPLAFKRKRSMNMAVYSLAHQEHLFVEITDRPYDAPMPGLARNNEGTLPVVPVTNLETGELALLIMPAVLKQILNSVSEPIGKRYEIKRGDIVRGKNYREVEVWEIE